VRSFRVVALVAAIAAALGMLASLQMGWSDDLDLMTLVLPPGWCKRLAALVACPDPCSVDGGVASDARAP
jgi:hypothetical protein